MAGAQINGWYSPTRERYNPIQSVLMVTHQQRKDEQILFVEQKCANSIINIYFGFNVQCAPHFLLIVLQMQAKFGNTVEKHVR